MSTSRRVYFVRVIDNKFLAPVDKDGHTYLQFSESATNAQFDIIDAGEGGRVRIKCAENEKYWTLDHSTNWIYAALVPVHTNNSLFIIKHDSENHSAFQSVGNNMYCKAFTQSPVLDCLMASASNLATAVKVTVVDV